jgi:hypothetical protein
MEIGVLLPFLPQTFIAEVAATPPFKSRRPTMRQQFSIWQVHLV